MAVLLGLCASIYIIIQFLDEENMLHLNLKFHVIAKCLPICLLIGRVRHKFGSMREMWQNQHAKNVFIALCFSLIADALLVYGKDEIFFLAGLGFFLIAVTFYMQAFGWKVLKLHILPITLISSVFVYYVVFQVYSKVPIEIQIGCFAYILVGQTAIWRAWARVDWNEVNKGRNQDLYAAFGVISFAASDITLAVNKFCVPIKHSGFFVMSSYYLAQYAISSAVRKEKIKI